MKVRNSTLFVGVVLFVLISAGFAVAADRCHRNLEGTRSLTLWADVTGYGFDGDRVVVDWSRSPTCAGSLSWNYASRTHTKTSVACQRRALRLPAAAATTIASSDASQLVRVTRAPSRADLPDRLAVFDRATGRRVASWPLFERPARVVLHDGIAILSAAERHGVYALRISDGRMALIGIARAGDRPLIGPAGVVYQDDVDRSQRLTAPAQRTLKLVPLSAVRRELARAFTTVRTYMSNSHSTAASKRLVWGANRAGNSASRGYGQGGAGPPRPFRTAEIAAISMDGPRVAIAVRDATRRCDRVLIWNVPWHYLTRLSDAFGQTCLPQHAPGGITDVAMAGGRASWTTTYGTLTRVIAATGTACREWIVARSRAAKAVLAGDGSLLAYGLGSADGASVGIVPKLWAGVEIGRSGSDVAAVAVDSGRIAVLRDSGVVTLRTRGGQTVATIRVGAARAISLRPGTLAVLTNRGTLDIYRTQSSDRVHSWRVPAGATSLDLHYGVALVTAGRDAYAVNVETGRAARLMHAPTRVSAELEGLGAVIQFNTQGRGHVRFLPMSRIEARIR